MVLVQPMGGSTAVVMTFSESVPHSAASSRLARLAELTGARVAAVEVMDTRVGASTGESKSAGRQTGVEAVLTGMRYSTDRAFILQPFVAALGDLGRFDVMFLTQRLDGFAGLRDWSGEGLTVRLVQDGAPYRYRFVVAPDATTLATLPVYQPNVTEGPEAVRANRDGVRPEPWLLVAAVLCGSAVFIFMLVRARMREARPSCHYIGPPREGKTS